jgi:hypothetical protein
MATWKYSDARKKNRGKNLKKTRLGPFGKGLISWQKM